MDVVRELADRIIVLHNGQLVADGEPAEVIALAGRAGGLPGRGAEGGRHERRPARSSHGVHTHIGAYHILHGVDLAVPRGQLTMLLGRNGAGKTTTLRTIMGLWHASQGSVRFGGQDITRAAHAADRRTRHRLRAREHGHLLGPHGEGEHAAGRARARRTPTQMDDTRLQWIFKLFPAVEKFWNHPAGKLSGGQKQMLAVSRAHRRAARAAHHRRAEQGPRAGHHQQHDRRLRELKRSGVDDPAGRAEHQLRASAWATRWP